MIVEEDEKAEDKIERHKQAMLAAFPNRPKLYQTLYPKANDEDEQFFQMEEGSITDIDLDEVMELITTNFEDGV